MSDLVDRRVHLVPWVQKGFLPRPRSLQLTASRLGLSKRHQIRRDADFFLLRETTASAAAAWGVFIRMRFDGGSCRKAAGSGFSRVNLSVCPDTERSRYR